MKDNFYCRKFLITSVPLSYVHAVSRCYWLLLVSSKRNVYVTLKSSREWTKTPIYCIANKTGVLSKESLLRVSLCENFERQICRKIVQLSNDAQIMVGQGHALFNSSPLKMQISSDSHSLYGTNE